MNDLKIHCVTSVASVGCSFLDWSLLWLSGQPKVFHIDSMQWHNIVADPLQKQLVSNAHGHIKNHKSGWQRNKQDLKKIINGPAAGLVSMYPFPLHLSDCCQALDLPVADLQDSSIMQQVTEYQKQDYVKMLDWIVCDQHIPVIYVDFDPSIAGYRWTRRSLDRLIGSPQRPVSVQHSEQEYQDVFFARSQQHWADLGLTEIWDIRERQALDTRPFAAHWGDDLLLEHDHCWVHCQDLWFDTERTVRAIMAWLGLDVIEENAQHWRPIMRSWQQIHNDSLRFPRQLPKILKSIINNTAHDLSWLTFEQEVIIQHCLIYHHGLNIKTHNLKKFPACATELHALLEPNFHPAINYD